MSDPSAAVAEVTDSAPRTVARGPAEIADAARRMVWYLRRHVLDSPGRRAALRRSLGGGPGEARTFAAFREVSRFVPESASEETELAFRTVAALICAQPRQARDEDVAAAAPLTGDATDDAKAVDGEQAAGDAWAGAAAVVGRTDAASAEPEGSSSDEQTADVSQRRPPRSIGATLAFAVEQKVTSSSQAEAQLHRLCRGDVQVVHRHLPRLMALLRSSRISVDWAALVCDLAAWDDDRQRIAASWLRDYYRGLTPSDQDGHDTDDTPKDIA
ncbi:CRISPR system Cascade subunit CasB [Actinoalloteichus hoggarensis]|uniref:CRISPR-associated protein Cse2 (CRISPR_cse2) n=1 Tax=Actinoalloteichus hoggarensis TaxID=1470176 RepID=A0A221W5H5_9PSEU|nr:type I-E CRISPR-associated protein Cse2/CasB [Actinoalloteichus hoggarensis]ASO20767.1 CRISPR-associated protein Cse2 (CRISPR_cse2) [Actinoalloteichus hoggarensis]MBB5920697.1 CRISPR system Cascade subunit CasB [Actinoalloteichus hoggarensis]